MAGGKLSPRQKMINMMYLVLMALLALNVSKEILKSFHLMEVSFNRAKENLDTKISKQMKAFEKQAGNDPTLQPYYSRALEAQKITNGFVTYIQDIKDELEEKTGGRQDFEDGEEGSKPYEAELTGMDNMEVHANYFMVDNAEGSKEQGYKGKELEDMVNNTRTQLLALLKSDKKSGIEIDAAKMKAVDDACQLSAVLEASEKKYKSWSAKYLEHSPLAGVITMLTKMQSDAKATQGAVLDVLNQGDVPTINISGLIPMVRPINGSVVMRGGSYEAEIFLAAETKGSENDEYVLSSGGGSLEKKDGKWIYSAAGGTSGNYDFKGIVKVKTPKGTEEYPFDGAYQVFEGGATISATKMNVLYIGVDNDISVGVPGVNPNDVTVSMTGGRISRKGKNYVARCTNRGKAVISASAKMSDGTTRRVGSAEYRVKKLPKPIGKWGGIASGTPSPKPALMAQSSVIASMGEGFVLDGISYSVQSFQFVLAPRRGEAFITKGNGPRITGAMKGAIKRAKRGDRIIVDQIRANGPGGRVTLQPIMIELI